MTILGSLMLGTHCFLQRSQHRVLIFPSYTNMQVGLPFATDITRLSEYSLVRSRLGPRLYHNLHIVLYHKPLPSSSPLRTLPCHSLPLLLSSPSLSLTSSLAVNESSHLPSLPSLLPLLSMPLFELLLFFFQHSRPSIHTYSSYPHGTYYTSLLSSSHLHLPPSSWCYSLCNS